MEEPYGFVNLTFIVYNFICIFGKAATMFGVENSKWRSLLIIQRRKVWNLQ